MSPAVVTFLGLGVVTYLFKSTGPLLLGGRRLPASMERVVGLVPAPLLAALVMVSTVTSGDRFQLDARLAGLVAAAVALRLKANFLVAVVVAAGITALFRASFG